MHCEFGGQMEGNKTTGSNKNYRNQQQQQQQQELAIKQGSREAGSRGSREARRQRGKEAERQKGRSNKTKAIKLPFHVETSASSIK